MCGSISERQCFTFLYKATGFVFGFLSGDSRKIWIGKRSKSCNLEVFFSGMRVMMETSKAEKSMYRIMLYITFTGPSLHKEETMKHTFSIPVLFVFFYFSAESFLPDASFVLRMYFDSDNANPKTIIMKKPRWLVKVASAMFSIRK